MGAVLNRSAAKDGVIAYQDHENMELFHYLPARIDAIKEETLLDFNVTYFGINPNVYYVDFGNNNQESVVGGMLSGRAKPDITSSQRDAILNEINTVFEIEKANLVPLEITDVKVQPIFAKSIAEMGERSNSDFPEMVKFGSTFNYQVASGNSLFAELVGSERPKGITESNPEFALNINGLAEFYGDPWKATLKADLSQVWEYTRTRVDIGVSLGWLDFGTQIDDITQSLIRDGIIEIEYIEGSGGAEFGRQLLESTKQVFEAINQQVSAGEGMFKFDPNPEPQQPKDPEKNLGASMLPWSVSINVGYDKNSFSQSISFEQTISFTGKLPVPVTASMNLSVPCNSSNSNLFYDLQTKETGCITVKKSDGLQTRIRKEKVAKNVEIIKLRDSLLNGKIDIERYSVLKADLNTFSLTEHTESLTRSDGNTVSRTLSVEEASAKWRARHKTVEQEFSKESIKIIHLYPGNYRAKITTCNQVDSTSPDAFLDCCRTHLTSYKGNDSVISAVDGFLGCLPASGSKEGGIAKIFGHGAPGDMNWGGGAGSGNNKTQVVKSSTIKYWSINVERLRGATINILELGSCNVGAYEIGAQLLWELAQSANCVVMGGTGKLFCGKNGLSWEEGSVFQYGYPDSEKPQPPISPPKNFFGVKDLKSLNLVNPHTGAVESINIGNVSYSSFMPYGKSMASWESSGNDVEDILSQANFETPLLIKGTPASYVEGEFKLEIKGEPQPRRFTVFRCLLIEDKDSPGIFYEITDAFLAEIQ